MPRSWYSGFTPSANTRQPSILRRYQRNLAQPNGSSRPFMCARRRLTSGSVSAAPSTSPSRSAIQVQFSSRIGFRSLA